jgi:hypothetical protein
LSGAPNQYTLRQVGGQSTSFHVWLRLLADATVYDDIINVG